MGSREQPAANLARPLERRFEQLTEPFNRFVSNQVSGAILLLAATLAALLFANTSLHPVYAGLEKIEAGVFFQDFELSKSLHHWVNDGLMVLFFFLLGLEIKREIMAGELRSFSRASTVLLAALGGMLFPALLYTAFNLGSETSGGWGVPMATDTAFALGALALLGKQVPAGLKVFLVALAIVDDIGAIVVIALFYTDTLNLDMLWLAVAVAGVLLLLNRLGVRQPLPYLAVSIVLWYAVLQSGIHATIAGVIAALAIPARPRLHPWFLARKLREAADTMDGIDKHNPRDHLLGDTEKHGVIEAVESRAKDTQTPLRSWEITLERPVSLLVVPLFAFLNAGVVLSMETASGMLDSPMAWGIVAGLLAGKPAGILLMSWLATRLGWGSLPSGVTLMHLAGLGLLAGMGFTMSIFVAGLSFGGQAELLTQAKASIMLATTLAGVLGIVWLWLTPSGRSVEVDKS